MKGEKGNPGIGTQGPRGPPGPAGKSSCPTANCRMETPSLQSPLDTAGEADGHVSLLHPCGRLERRCVPSLSLEGQRVSEESPVHQAQSTCEHLTDCRSSWGQATLQ